MQRVSTTHLFGLLILLLLFSGCDDILYKESSAKINTSENVESSEDNSTSIALVNGRFLDDYVQGLDYSCSSGESNTTTEEGYFTCPEGENVTFYLSSVPFGMLLIENKTVTPYSFFDGNITAAVNLARLLQTLDDNTTEDRININKTLEALLPDDLNFTSDTFESDVQEALNIELIDYDTAHKAMNDALSLAGESIPESAIIVDINVTEEINTSIEINSSVENIAPIINNSEIVNIAENQRSVLSVDAFDENSDTLIYALSGNDSTYFLLDEESGVLTLKTNADYELKSTYAITLNVSDGDLNASQDIVVTVINSEETPLLSYANMSVNENQAAGAKVGTLTVLSQGDDEVSSFSLNGVGSENFRIDTLGEITTRVSFDAEEVSFYSLKAFATNSVGDGEEVDVNVTINSLPDVLPTLVSTTLSVLENTKSADSIGSLTISNSGDTPISKIVLSGDGSSNFFANANGVVGVGASASLDYENIQEYNLQAIATNSAGESNRIDLKIYVNNVIDEKAIIADSIGSIDENATVGEFVALMNVTYAGDSNGSFTLKGEGSELFVISDDGRVTLKESGSLDYETITSYKLDVIMKNEAGESNSAQLSITVNNVAEVPILEASNLSVFENKIAGDRVGEISILYGADSEITDLNLSGDGSENFSVDTHGVITLSPIASLDFESQNSYYLTAIAVNNAGASKSVDVNISIQDYLFNPFQIAKLTSSMREPGDMFGSSVAVSGDYILVGSPYEDVDGIVSAGAAYLFKKSSDGEIAKIAKISASDAEVNDNFGFSLDIDGENILIGAPNEDESGENSGAIYLYKLDENDSVVEIEKVLSSNANDGDNFGASVALDGSYFIVGAHKEDTTLEDSGSIYAFKLENGLSSEIGMVKSDDIQSGENFGRSIGLRGGYFIVGAPKRDTRATEAGRAYLFSIDENDTVSQVAFIEADDGEEYDNFGMSTSIDGDYIAIGSPMDDVEASNAGSVYVYRISDDETLVQVSKLTSTNPQSGESFGSSVSINNRYLAVGSYKNDAAGVDSGKAYAYQIDADESVTLVSIFAPSDETQNSMFGNAIAIDGDNIAVGAFNDSEGGSAYLFDSEPVEKIYVYNKDESFVNLDEGVIANLFSIDAKSPNGDLHYMVEGLDGDNFMMNGTIVQNIAPFDYENPFDVGGDNSYSASLLITDPLNVSGSVNLNVNIMDKHYLQVAKAYANDSQADARFANAVALSQEYIALGMPYDDANGVNSGSVYIFKREAGGVKQIAKIQADDGTDNDLFGSSIAMDGEYILIGASKNDALAKDAGSAYIFKINGDESVSQVAKVLPSDGAEDDLFGDAVAISGRYFIVGSPNDDSQSGSVYAYKILDDGSVEEVQKIRADDAQDGDGFGSSLDIDANYIVVGAKNEDENGIDSGSAYLFKIGEDDTLAQMAKIVASNGSASDLFGASVSISAERIVVGAKGEDSFAIDAGLAYLFKIREDDSVEEIASLRASNASASDNFGACVSIQNSRIFIGSSGREGSRSTYVYQVNDDETVMELQKISSDALDDGFGSSLALRDGLIVIGADGDDSLKEDSGAFWVFEEDINQ